MTALTTQSDSQPRRYGLQVSRTDDGVDSVVRLGGELELATAARVREEFERALGTGCARLTVDLRGLQFLDSTGMHALVEAHERCRATERTFTLLLTPGAVQRTLAVCGLLDVLEHDVPEALAA